MNNRFTTPAADDIRKMVLTNWDMLHGLIISAAQREIYRTIVKHGEMDSAKLAIINNTTTHVTGAQLRALYDRGYLSRHHISNGTGGTFFNYVPLVELPQE